MAQIDLDASFRLPMWRRFGPTHRRVSKQDGSRCSSRQSPVSDRACWPRGQPRRTSSREGGRATAGSRREPGKQKGSGIIAGRVEGGGQLSRGAQGRVSAEKPDGRWLSRRASLSLGGLVQGRVTPWGHKPEAQARVSRTLACASGLSQGQDDSATCYPNPTPLEPGPLGHARCSRHAPCHLPS
jgi:hypothetical protein